MTEITHDALDGYLKRLTPEQAAAVYLAHGEEMLCQKAARALTDHLLGTGRTAHQVDRVEGNAAGAVAEALARVNTYSLLGGTKVVLLADARVFHDRADSRGFLEKARTAQQNDQMAKAAKALMAVLGFHRLALDDIDADARRRLLLDAELDPDQDGWLDTLVSWCRQQDLRVPPGEDDAQILTRTLEQGIPAGHHLIVTAEGVDRRRKLYKAFEAAGVVVDCTVPTGDRMADREVQQRVLHGEVRRILGPSGKRLEPEAFKMLVDMTGFDLRTFSGGLEKLIDYSGARSDISVDDVREVLSRSKKDPIYVLTGAVGDRRLLAALQSLDSLLANEVHPLQVLAALVNQVRRLLLARSFIDGPEGRCWHQQMAYNDFQRQVLPLLADRDRRLRDQVAGWRPEKSDAKGRVRGIDTDLVLVKNPKSPYPVYLLFKQAERFSAALLQEAVVRLAAVDRSLKSTGAPARWVLESLLWFLCQGQRA